MTLLGISARKCGSFLADETDTRGYIISVELCGLLVELWLTVRK